MEEIWRDIEGYEGLYEVSNLGRVRSLGCIIKLRHNCTMMREGKVLKLDNRNGYLYAGLSKKGVLKGVGVHRLVAKAFIPNPNNLPQVNHIDANRANNHINNLEWVTCSDNHKHAFKLGNRNSKGSKNAGSKLTEEQAISIKYGYSHLSSREVATLFGICVTSVNLIRSGRGWKHI
jgi:hypothetical protein